MDVAPFLGSFKELNRGVVRLLDAMSALSALAQLEPHVQHEPELLESVLRILLENQDIERCSVFLLDGEKLINKTGIDWADVARNGPAGEPGQAASAAGQFALGEGIVGQAALTGEVQYCENCAEDPRFAVKASSANNASGSLMCAPVKFAGDVLGVLCIYHPQASAFGQDQQRFFQLFASFLGQILANVRYTQRLENDIQRRTKQLEEALLRTRELKERFQHLSIIDELTELHNRRFFFPEAQAALSRALRYRSPFSVMILDLDHFKAINDRFGHVAGDRILQQIGALLRGQTREGDILARFGGEEFVLALPNTDDQGAQLLASRILTAVREAAWDVGSSAPRVTASIGLSVLAQNRGGSDDSVLDELLHEADQALYVSKKRGRDQTTRYRPEMESSPQ